MLSTSATVMEIGHVGFAQRLFDSMRLKGNPIVAGIDPRVESLPIGLLEKFDNSLQGRAEAFLQFGSDVLRVIAPLVPAVKFQAAFYEALGPHGMAALSNSILFAKSLGLLVILDGKRNDIGSTAEAYAQAYLDSTPAGAAGACPWDVDCLTINPYLGSDGIQPFSRLASASGRGLFVLVRTSNPSAREIQDLVSGGRTIYQHVAELVNDWARPLRDESGYSLMGAVVGATYPDELAELRASMPGIVFLVPGYGAQGGTARDVASAFDENGLGAVVNNSRGLTFAFHRKDLASRFGSNWQRAIEEAALEMINDLALNTPARLLRTNN